jgi:hypothetical protein
MPPPADYGAMADAAEQKYGLPAGVLRGLVHVESRGHPDAVSPQGAVGLAQLLPSTAASLGVDPTDPAQAIDGAARYLKQGIDKTGSVQGGLMYYHGGPDQSGWGPKTQAYPGQVLAATGAELGGGDPTAAAADDPNDPFLAALSGVQQQNGQPDNPAANPSGAGGGNPASGVPVPDASAASDGGSVLGAIGRYAASTDPALRALTGQGGLGAGLQDVAAGVANGVSAIPETALKGTAGLLRAAGSPKVADTLSRWGDNLDTFTKGMAADPNSAIFKSRSLLAEALSAAPVSELAPLEALGVAGKVGRYGDMAAQGGLAGALLSRGKDVGLNTAIGAAGAPVLGAAFDAAGPGIIKVAEALGNSKLANALRSRLPAAEADVPEAAAQTIAKGTNFLPPIKAPEGIAQFDDETGAPLVKIETVDGRQVPSYGVEGQPGSRPPAKPQNVQAGPTTTIPAEALGSRGARTGIEAHDQMDAPTAAIYQKLVGEGVSPADALREADARANGAEPTASMVTRNPAMMQAEKEGAKAVTPEGQAINAQQAQANNALHGSVQGMIADMGGATSSGDAMQSAAESLQKASDTDRSAVRAAYKAADEEAAAQAGATDTANAQAQDTHSQIRAQLEAETQARNLRKLQGGGSPARAPVVPDAPAAVTAPGYIDLSSVRSALHTPQLANPTVEGGKTLRNGVLGLMDAFKRPGDLYTADEAEQIRQAIGQAYDPMGGGLNHHIGVLKSAVDKAMDATEGSASYKAARALHKAWADKYDNPEGIARLIRADTKGNLVNDDSWRQVGNLVGQKNDKPFIQIVRQLKANGDTASLNKLKASIVQDAYEHATGRAAGTATDSANNSVFRGSMFHNRLNAIGMTKLKALFSPAEVARLAGIGRAGTVVNEAVPGAVNTSGTASALLNALARQNKTPGKAAGIVDHALHAVLPLAGAVFHGGEGAGVGVAADALRKGASAAAEASAQRKAAAQLAESLRNLSSPQATRAADAAHAKMLADALRRAASARAASSGAAPALAAASGERR